MKTGEEKNSQHSNCSCNPEQLSSKPMSFPPDPIVAESPGSPYANEPVSLRIFHKDSYVVKQKPRSQGNHGVWANLDACIPEQYLEMDSKQQ